MRSFFITSLLIIVSFAFVQSASAQGLQCQTFSELTGPRLEGVFSGEITSGSTIQAAFDRVVAFLQTDLGARVGRKVPHKDLGCVEIKGMHVSLAYDDGRKSGTLAREFGDTTQAAHYYTVSFFYDRAVQRGTETLQEVYDMVVEIALKTIDPELELTAGKDTLFVGEQTEITARLRCGDCSLEKEGISFQVKKGPGRISPAHTSTDANGLARTIFTAEEEGKAVVCATYQPPEGGSVTQCVEISIVSGIVGWKVEIIAEYYTPPGPHGLPADYVKIEHIMLLEILSENDMDEEEKEFALRGVGIPVTLFPRINFAEIGFDPTPEGAWFAIWFKRYDPLTKTFFFDVEAYPRFISTYFLGEDISLSLEEFSLTDPKSFTKTYEFDIGDGFQKVIMKFSPLDDEAFRKLTGAPIGLLR